VSRKRSRRISTTSAAAHGSLWSDEGVVEDGFQTGTAGERGRKSPGSRASFSPGAGGRGRPYSASTPTARPYRNSSTSHIPGPSNSISVPPGGLTSPLTTMLPDNSQTALEKVINARLVETFIAISIPQPLTPVGTPSSVHTPRSHSSLTCTPRDRSSASQVTKKFDTNLVRKAKVLPGSPSVSPRSPPTSKATNGHDKSVFTSTLRPNGKINGTLHSFPSPQKHPPPYEPQLPNYISPIRQPSTNPSFPMDIKSSYNLSEGTNLSGDKIKIEIWGRVGDRWKRDVSFQRLEKEMDEELDKEWKILDEWLVDLTDLVPLSDNVRACLLLG
jgi:UV radiation resistance-associated gene protein